MSILSFLDTAYDTYQHSLRSGGPKSLTENSKYSYNTLRYPLDVGNFDKGHYIVIHINAQNQTQFNFDYSGDKTSYVEDTLKITQRRGAITAGAITGTALDLAGDLISKNEYLKDAYSTAVNFSGSDFSKYVSTGSSTGNEIVRESLNSIGSAFDFTKGLVQNLASTPSVRTTKRVTDSIALYMPNTLAFDYSQAYDTLNTSAGAAAGIMAAAQSAVDTYNEGGRTGAIVRNVSPFVVNALASAMNLGDFGKAQVFGLTQMVQNPRLELIYTKPDFRSFRMDFQFYARDEKEALEVQNILDRLRFHQAPEIKSNSGGYFLIPPSEFDIKFYYNGKINPNIDPVSSCVLTGINIDYAPGGFTAYERLNELRPALGRTGMPVNINLSLSFTETLYITKDKYSNTGFGTGNKFGNLDLGKFL